jgi:crotonobetainyl-CoA:carnitine CoA-transferase CaiB-like acyl-CoA transferase
MVAAAPIEQKFWNEFCELIGLEEALRDDTRDMAATTRRVGEIIGSQPAEHWRARFTGRDCCCSVVATLKEAMDDPQFRARGLFDRVVTNEIGGRMPALPVPIVSAFRGSSDVPAAAPPLGANNSEYKA